MGDRTWRLVGWLLLVGSLSAWQVFWLARPINLATADLGRHLTNGRLLTREWTEHGVGVLTTNYYSYTWPAFPFRNHHWGSGVVFYAVERAVGMFGLHVAFIGLSVLTLLVFIAVARQAASPAAVWLAGVLLMPLIGWRAEVRPEVFSYLLAGVYWLLLSLYSRGRLRRRALLCLPLLMAGWVNLHVYFYVGLIVLAVFWITRVAADGRRWWREQRRGLSAQSRWLALVLGLTVLASLLNPAGARALAYPLTLAGNYGYSIVENQSVPWLIRWGMAWPNFTLFSVLGGLLLVMMAWGWWRRWPGQPAAAGLAAMSWLMAFVAVRNFTLFGYLAWPLLSAHLTAASGEAGRLVPRAARWQGGVVVAAAAVLSLYFQQFDALRQQWQALGVGLAPGVNGAADFITAQDLRGPLFNNYDSGSYFIYHLFPRERVFVDNRPEAYPATFFQDVYIPMQQNGAVWREQLKHYQFRLIAFYRHDLTDWGQKFLAARSRDPEWRLIYADSYHVIFRRASENPAP